MTRTMLWAAALTLGGCAGPQVPPGTSTLQAPEYQLGAGDRLRVTVFGEDALTGDYNVTSQGDISFPLIGDVIAHGRTVKTLRDAITARLADGYMLDPRVTLEVLNYRPYYILGEVEKAGEYPYASDLSLLQAVAIAGGYSYRANRKTVFIRRANDTTERAFELSGATPVWILPGDTIRVGERYF